MPIGFKSKADFDRTNAATLAHEKARTDLVQRRANPPVVPGGGYAICVGRLTSPIVACADGLAAPTSFTFRRWNAKTAGGVWTEEDTDTTGYHRDSRTGEIGAIVHCGKVGPEWHAIEIEPVCQE